ncbi:PPE-like protein, partial [Mya arenaria]
YKLLPNFVNANTQHICGRYVCCSPGHVHSRGNHVMGCAPSLKDRPSDSTTNSIRSAVLIQKWYRRYRANLEIRRRCTWNIFQSIEYSGEQDQLKLHNFFNAMLSNMVADGDGPAPLIQAFNILKFYNDQLVYSSDNVLAFSTFTDFIIADTQTMVDRMGDTLNNLLDGVEVEKTYKGPHLTFPLTLNQLHKMVQSFKRKLTLHAKYTVQLLLEVRRLLKAQGNIRYASTSLSKQVTVCGDLHGNLSDLYMIFHKNGLPSVNNPYIFNGDFVDRGQFSTEVALVLFSCFLMNPNEVYLNRGNHEDHVMNIRYGFVKELQMKYREHSRKVISLFKDVFSWLPLATVVDEQILVCHGGISDTTDLKLLAKIDRHRYMSTLQPPGGCDDISTMSQEELLEWKQVLDLLWSDPRAADGCYPNTFRGGGTYFGADVTANFLQQNGLKLLIRSHECKSDGYEYTHNGQVLTVFSASNYYEMGSNLGAYVRIQGSGLECRVVQYMSAHSPALRKVSFTQRINHVEQSALQDLKDRILASKCELLKEFTNYDLNHTGNVLHYPWARKLSSSDWCFAMETVLEMELPWRMLKTKVAKCDNNGDVMYESTFEELEEFEDALTILTRQLDIRLKEAEISDIAHSLDLNNDGCIDFNEFLEAFRIVDNLGKDQTRKVTRDNSNDDVIIHAPDIAGAGQEA